MELISKVCKKCEIEKPLTSFNNQTTGKYGKRSTCRECQNEENKAYKQTDRGKELRKKWKQSRKGRENEKRYRERNKDKITINWY